MNILVCIKQVPDIEQIKIDSAKRVMIMDGVPNIVNQFDTYALETAVRVKDADPATKVFVVTMGPAQTKDAMKSCLSVGADRAYMVTDEIMNDSDTLATSYVLSRAAKAIEAREGIAFDLILCGKQAADGDTGHVGPQLAEYLNYPQITSASEITVEAGKLSARRPTEEGAEVVAVELPAVVTMSQTAYEPRYASVKTKMAANRAEIPVLTAADLDLDTACVGSSGSPSKVIKTFVPERKKGGVKIQEETAELSVDKLTALLSDAGVI
jgi:electron transfer flavoprotein alpha/beta subunit